MNRRDLGVVKALNSGSQCSFVAIVIANGPLDGAGEVKVRGAAHVARSIFQLLVQDFLIACGVQVLLVVKNAGLAVACLSGCCRREQWH